MSETHTWWKEAVIYQIYPRSFADSNGDGIGDIPGIIGKLDYLEELGIDAIWLTPIYASPNADNGYDISDYYSIMAEFGTMNDFEKLLTLAHQKNIKVVMDLVANHTSDEHSWFVESRKSKDNPYRDYYIWKDGKDDAEPNNWGSVFGGSAWQKDDLTGQYYLHLFDKKQPDLNWANPKVRDEIFSFMKWLCDKGIDGFRMDAIAYIGKEGFENGRADNGMPYGPFDEYTANRPATHKYLQEMREKVLDKYDLLTIGETGGVTPQEAVKYANYDGSELNMVFQFEHVDINGITSGENIGKKVTLNQFREVLNRWQTELEGKAWNSLYLSNHDQPRCVSRFGNDSPMYRERSAKMLAVCAYMMKGTPFIYQGEELGMTNIYFTELSDYKDVFVFTLYQQYVESGFIAKEDMMRYLALLGRDNSRTPMQWNTSENAGFTTGTPWIKINKNYLEINAEDELKNPESVFHFYKKLIQLRHTNKTLVYGKFIPLMEDDSCIYAYQRVLDNQTITVLSNFSEQTVLCDSVYLQGKELISNYKEHKDNQLYPYEARVLINE